VDWIITDSGPVRFIISYLLRDSLLRPPPCHHLSVRLLFIIANNGVRYAQQLDGSSLVNYQDGGDPSSLWSYVLYTYFKMYF